MAVGPAPSRRVGLLLRPLWQGWTPRCWSELRSAPMSSFPDLNTNVPHAARVYDYVLGGKDNFEPDRVVAEAMMAASGELLRDSMRANRRFMARVGRYLAGGY